MRSADLTLLGLAPYASQRQAASAYRTLAKVYHPDAGGTSERFREIHAAYARIKPLLSSGSRPEHIDVYA